MREKTEVIVIGGGPAGLMAAGTAAGAGARVRLLEKMPQPGRKLALTGKGRCNITNIAPRPEFEACFGVNGPWLAPAFDAFFSNALMAFLEAEGIRLTTERGGRVFPENGRAADVVKALVQWVRRQGAVIETQRAVALLRVEAGAMRSVQTGAGWIDAHAVVLACGGSVYPGTGSTGDGYRMAKATGHGIVPPRPALVPLECYPAPARELAGLGLKNVQVTLWVDGSPVCSRFGEMGFSATGLNGPVVLALSGLAVDALRAGREVRLVVDLKPALSQEKLKARLRRDLAARGDEPMRSVLRGVLPRGLVGSCLGGSGIQGLCPGRRLTEADVDGLVRWMKGMAITISGHRGMDEAIITAGGVALDDVNPWTMESKRVRGLYFAGEILDVHAETGGYNLQAAFSTGVLAGCSIKRHQHDVAPLPTCPLPSPCDGPNDAFGGMTIP